MMTSMDKILELVGWRKTEGSVTFARARPAVMLTVVVIAALVISLLSLVPGFRS